MTLWALRERVFSVFGPPLVIVADNGSGFSNALMKASEELYGYRWIHVMPHNPQANGLAEAGVKKLKIMLDRHTLDYQNWHWLLPSCQEAVNQRKTKGLGICPFTALFCRAPTTLAAMENPSLLPEGTEAERDIKELGLAMARLHKRLSEESDEIKRLAVATDKAFPVGRRVQPGDRIWLNYSDSERARYIRKHGHGKAWRHPFVVMEVKPHAVRLKIPTDGSVPSVLPWQSLRKCSFAAPLFHDADLPVPDVDEHCLPLAPATAASQQPVPAAPVVRVPQDDTRYVIDRIISAARVGSGWQLQVKWKGYDEVTSEPLSHVLRQTGSHPEVLRDIEKCKADYLSQHPSVVLDDPAPEVVASRVQPSRARGKPTRLVYAVTVDADACRSTMLGCAMNILNVMVKRGCAALKSIIG